MIQSSLAAPTHGENSLGLPTAEKYCLFQRATVTFGLLATAVREVAIRPSITVVPDADPLLAGICHIRNEFLPVVRSERVCRAAGPRSHRRTDYRHLVRQRALGAVG